MAIYLRLGSRGSISSWSSISCRGSIRGRGSISGSISGHSGTNISRGLAGDKHLFVSNHFRDAINHLLYEIHL